MDSCVRSMTSGVGVFYHDNYQLSVCQNCIEGLELQDFLLIAFGFGLPIIHLFHLVSHFVCMAFLSD